MIYLYEIVLLVLILAIVFCFGTIIGSFLNVVILRAFSGESIVLPPSKCPKCRNKLKWWHNIPILSYLILRGKCGFCHEPISIQYPLIELLTGILFLAVFFKYGIMPETLFGFAIVSILLVLTVTDIKKHIVFDCHTYFLIGLGLIYNLIITAIAVYNKINTITGFHPDANWWLYNPLSSSILGLILGAVIMLIVAKIGEKIAGAEAFGEGDTYIAAGLGAVFGWQNILLILILAVVLQVIAIIPLFVKNQITIHKDWKTPLAMMAFFIYGLTYLYFAYKTTIFLDLKKAIIAIIPALILAIYSCKRLIEGLHNGSGRTEIPFGPALAIAGILVLLTNISF